MAAIPNSTLALCGLLSQVTYRPDNSNLNDAVTDVQSYRGLLGMLSMLAQKIPGHD